MNKIGLYIFFSLGLNMLILTFFRSMVNMDFACVSAIILYIFFTQLTFKSLPNTGIVLKLSVILLGTIVVHLPMKIIDFKGQLISLPELVCELIGVILGLFFFYSNVRVRVIVVIIAISISLITYFNYYRVLDFINYSNLFNKNIRTININSVPYLDSCNNYSNDLMFDSKQTILLNIWATTCGPCIAEFSLIDSLNHLAMHNGRIKLLTACILQEIDNKTPFEIAKMKKTSFPIFTIANWNLVLSKYGLDGVPVTFVIKDKQIKFRGSLKGAWNFANSY